MHLSNAADVTVPRANSGRGETRLRELDSLRGIAASCVLLFHITYWGDVHHQFGVHITWGHYGVELFFVLSGFVIFMTMERSGRVVEFAISRVARLYPAYWCAVLLTTLVALLLKPSSAPTFPQVLGNLTMLTAVLRIPAIDYSYWTLTVELMFYCLIVVWFRFRSPRLQGIEWYALAFVLLALTVRAALTFHQFSTLRGPLAGPALLYYGQFFVIGICLFRVYEGKSSRLTIITLAAAGAVSLFGGSATSLSPGPGTYFFVTCTVTSLVWIAVRARPAILRNPVLLFLGDISYPLYLIHQRVGGDLMELAYEWHVPTWLAATSVIAVLIACAFAINRLVEVPGRTFLRKQLRSQLVKWDGRRLAA
jgi:peptidoglycan/LPS O-acetylase OafA/YrhL